MKVNSIILNNEIWALELRLIHEYSFFDYFIITESETSFSGLKKILYFEKYRHRFKKFMDKIIYLPIKADAMPNVEKFEYLGHNEKLASENRWPLEHFQRNFCKDFIQENFNQSSAMIVFQDIDEIYPVESLQEMRPCLNTDEYISLLYHDYRGGIYSSQKNKDLFQGGYVLRGDLVKSNDLHDIRRLYLEHDGNTKAWHIINPGSAKNLDHSPLYNSYKVNLKLNMSSAYMGNDGWHFSNMTGGFSKLHSNKRKSWSHSEYSPNIDDESFGECDLVDEQEGYFSRISKNIEASQIDENIPDFVQHNLNNFPILIDS